MDLKSGYPFWIVKNGLLNAFPVLREAVDCDVLVVGAGITGALVAWHLQQDGHRVCVIDRREAGWGSTAASTALLQYEIDTELQDLAARYGEADAVLAYRACADAIPKLRRIARRFRGIDFQPMLSLYYASRWHHRSRLIAEAALRRKHGFDLRVLDEDDVRRDFGIDAPVAILTALAAETDPYQMAHRLLADIVRKGGLVFDRTTMAEFAPRRRDVLVHTDSGVRLRAQHLVFAAGYESQTYLDENVASNRSSYAFVTDPLEGGLGVLHDCLVWESARPYLYVRRTGDGRVLVGGEDDTLDISLKRDAMVMRKSAKLLKKASALFPALDLRPAFAWAGTFAETADGLPFFGPHPQHGPRVHFAMAYGGNGITYSLIGAELLRERIAGRPHACTELFSFARLKRM
jgi:glycine/D-amino acid oxidase-like deaminating enzyme